MRSSLLACATRALQHGRGEARGRRGRRGRAWTHASGWSALPLSGSGTACFCGRTRGVGGGGGQRGEWRGSARPDKWRAGRGGRRGRGGGGTFFLVRGEGRGVST